MSRFSILWGSDSDIESLDIKDEDVIRRNNMNVVGCLCGHCVPTSTHIESVCYLEIAAVQHRIVCPTMLTVMAA